MSALIVAFWFIAQGVALRYFVSEHMPYRLLYTQTRVGSVYRSHVVSLRCLGCYRRYHCTKSQCFRRVCVCTRLRMLSFARYAPASLPLPHSDHNIDSLGCPLARDRHNLFRRRSPRWSRGLQRICSTTKGGRIPFLTSPGFKIWSCFNDDPKRVSDVNHAGTVSIPRIIGSLLRDMGQY